MPQCQNCGSAIEAFMSFGMMPNANVMCHILDLTGVANGAQALLKPRGILVFEDPYLGDVVEKTPYDQVYGEHVFVSCSLLIAKETELGRDRAETFDTFRQNCEAARDQLIAVLNNLRESEAKVAGYGVTSKSTTVINYCGITANHIAFISDTTPTKQGKSSPCTHVPIRPYEDFVADHPHYTVVFTWNHIQEIMEKEQAYKAAGGKWINFIPKVDIQE